MTLGLRQAATLATICSLSVFLHGCTFGTETKNCDGDECSCGLDFHSFWARILISGVPIEHASRYFHIPDVAKDTPNATGSFPCCDAIHDQIDYDEGKKPSMPNKVLSNFKTLCASSTNSDVQQAATSEGNESLALGRRLRQAAPVTKGGMRAERRLYDNQPIYDGEEGQDCEVSSTGFTLNSVNITSGSMTLKVRWVDHDEDGDHHGTPCCDALRPVLQNVYIKGMPESQLPSEIRQKFCSSCTKSPNQGVALAAYRCFGSVPNVTKAEIDV